MPDPSATSSTPIEAEPPAEASTPLLTTVEEAVAADPAARPKAGAALNAPLRRRRIRRVLAMRRHRRWLSWVGVGVIGLAAVGSGIVSEHLRDHADERRQLIDELTQLEVLATGHSMTIWRALTLLMAEDKMGFIRLRGEAGHERTALAEQIEKVKALDAEGARINGLLGFEIDEETEDQIEAVGQNFMGGVRGALGQMNLSAERVRKRLRYSDFGFEAFSDVLSATKERQEEIAVECASVAKQVTSVASFARLLASVMLALSLSRFRREVAAANRVS